MDNLDGAVTDEIQAETGVTNETQAEDGTYALVPCGSTAPELSSLTLSTATYSRWTHDVYATVADTTNDYYGVGALTDAEVYTAIQSSVYDQTYYRYNSMGLQSEVIDPSGNITQTNYNALGLLTSVYLGTSDGTTWPGGFSNAASNIVEITSNQYDFGKGGGDGLLTSTIQYVDSSTTDERLTQYAFDWRDRQIDVVNPPDAQGNISYTMTTYDNLGEAIDTQQYLFQDTAANLAADLEAVATKTTPATLYSGDVMLAWTQTSF